MDEMDEQYKKAMDAIRDIFIDGSISVQETRAALKSLIDEIENMIDALPDEEPT